LHAILIIKLEILAKIGNEIEVEVEVEVEVEIELEDTCPPPCLPAGRKPLRMRENE